MPRTKYKLNIKTREGKNYTSDEQLLTTETKIDNMTATVETVDGQRGVQINVNSYDPANTSKYYRYEYTETYKIIAPMWYYQEANINVIPGTPTTPEREVIVVTNRVKEVKTCYSSKTSDAILLNNTSTSSEDRVHYPVRFISDQNYIISHRYTIMVKQYVQNLAAYTFYKTLRELSTSESILSPKQPGFFYGNMKSVENPNEKVIGFFEVSAVSSDRIYFNYKDLFPNDNLPPYYIEDCDLKEYIDCPGDLPCTGQILRSSLRSKGRTLFSWDHESKYFW